MAINNQFQTFVLLSQFLLQFLSQFLHQFYFYFVNRPCFHHLTTLFIKIQCASDDVMFITNTVPGYRNLIVTTIIVRIIIALKEQFEIFTISSLRCKLCPTHILKWPGCNHVQKTCKTLAFITCSICAKWYEGTAQLLNLKENRDPIYFSFILLAETIN